MRLRTSLVRCRRWRGSGIPPTGPTSTPTARIVDPYPHYARLRELGPVVWLSRQRVYALAGTPSARPCWRRRPLSSPATAWR